MSPTATEGVRPQKPLSIAIIIADPSGRLHFAQIMSRQNQSNHNVDSDVDVLDIQIPMFRVILYNDDYSTFDFVIHVLMSIFRKSEEEAKQITMNVHRKGKGVAGTYPKEIAEMKVAQVHQMAELAGYPLRAGIEA